MDYVNSKSQNYIMSSPNTRSHLPSSRHHLCSNFKCNNEDSVGTAKFDFKYGDTSTFNHAKIQELPEDKQVKCINIKTVTRRNKKKPWVEYEKWISNPKNVYVGRANKFIGAEGSKWGNPFSVDKFGREGCIQRYEEMLFKKSKRIIPRKMALISAATTIGETGVDSKEPEGVVEGEYDCKLVHYLSELRGKTLACWCKPLKCHSDILANAVMELEVMGAFEESDTIKDKTQNQDEPQEIPDSKSVSLNKMSNSIASDANLSSFGSDDISQKSLGSSMSHDERFDCPIDDIPVNEFGIPFLPVERLPTWNPRKCCKLHLEYKYT